MIEFEGRRILVVGGGLGIGLAAATKLESMGARVCVGDKDLGSKARLSGTIGFCPADATDPSSVDELFQFAAHQLGGLDGVFTTIGGASLGSFEDLSLDDWNREISFNLNSAFIVGKAAVSALKPTGGAIVLTSSGYGVMAGSDRAAYSASKAGVISFSRTLAAVAAPHGIRVNCIAPGPTDTPRFRAMNGGDEGVERVRKQMPLGSIPTPEDCANLALYLLSEAASQITGQTIHVNGGLLMP